MGWKRNCCGTATPGEHHIFFLEEIAVFGEDRFACEDQLSGAWHLEQRFKVGVDIGVLNQHNCKPREITSLGK